MQEEELDSCRAADGRRSAKRDEGDGRNRRGFSRAAFVQGNAGASSAPALLYAAICFFVTAAFFAVFFGAASGLAAVCFVVSAFFAAGFFLGW